MKNSLGFVTTTFLLSFSLIGIANAGDVDKRSLPLSGYGFACQVINVSSSDISIQIYLIPDGGGGTVKKGIIGPDEVTQNTSGPLSWTYSEYCRVQYVGRPGDIVATFCALDEVGNCTVYVPMD